MIHNDDIQLSLDFSAGAEVAPAEVELLRAFSTHQHTAKIYQFSLKKHVNKTDLEELYREIVDSVSHIG